MTLIKFGDQTSSDAVTILKYDITKTNQENIERLVQESGIERDEAVTLIAVLETGEQFDLRDKLNEEGFVSD